jgi:hypothetical protein
VAEIAASGQLEIASRLISGHLAHRCGVGSWDSLRLSVQISAEKIPFMIKFPGSLTSATCIGINSRNQIYCPFFAARAQLSLGQTRGPN